MSRRTKIIIFITTVTSLGLLYVFTYKPGLSPLYGSVQTKLYLGKSDNQPLIVAFGGGEGGNDWARDYLKPKRDSLLQAGYSLLALGYFNTEETPEYLDRISLNAIKDTIIAVAQNPKIDGSKIVLMGGSRGGELALNLASRFKEFNGVIAMSTSHVSFPAITWTANTSSWMYNSKEVNYVPAPIKSVLPSINGDLYGAYSIMLENEEAVKLAEIPVERINGPILILSGKDDDQWPATDMSEQIVRRLKETDFNYYYSHIQLEGGHRAPLQNFNLVYDFLKTHFKVNH